MPGLFRARVQLVFSQLSQKPPENPVPARVSRVWTGFPVRAWKTGFLGFLIEKGPPRWGTAGRDGVPWLLYHRSATKGSPIAARSWNEYAVSDVSGISSPIASA